MKRLLFSLILVSLAYLGHAQYGNEWIEYSRPYYAFKIADDGVYRIDSTALSNAGINVNALDPSAIQLFNRGQQVPIYIEGESDGSFDGGDFIEFHASSAKGTDDLGMWEDPAHLASADYSVINDTIKYFLSWDLVNSTPLRYIQRDSVDFTNYTPIDYYWTRSVQSLTGVYQVGERNSDGASSSFMVQGEGWFDAPIQSTANTAVRNRNVFSTRRWNDPSAPDSRCKIAWVGCNNPGGATENDHHSVISYGNGANIVLDTVFRGYKKMETEFTLPTSSLGSSTTQFRLSVIHDLPLMSLLPNYPDKQTLAYIDLYYPRTWQMANLVYGRIDIEDDPSNADRMIRMTQMNSQPHFLIQGLQPIRVSGVQVGASSFEARIPPATGSDTVYMYFGKEGSIPYINELTPVNGSGFFTDYDALETDSALIMVTHSTLMNEAMAYAGYRNSSWNSYNTAIFDVEELYDQFGQGIPKHPLAIRGLVKYLVNEWSTMPRALFLMGKSVKEATLSNSDPGSRKNAAAYEASLVPSFGYPPSDPAFVFYQLADSSDIAFPVGRISAKNGAELSDYLSKVQEFESHTSPEPWMKTLLHFVGGTDAIEQAYLGSFMSDYERIASDTCFGADVHTFTKSSGVIIQQATSDSISDLIANGVTLMTFFAHASGSGFDISIDNPLNYNWNTKYPMLIGNSCYTGNIHLLSNSSTSEQFCLPPQHGAIAFLASVDLGYSDLLGNYSTHWYESFSFRNYGGSIGEHSRYAIEKQLEFPTERKLNNVLTFTLMGDPSLILHSFPQPEFETSPDLIRFNPVDVTTEVDSFDVHVRVLNSGKATNDDVTVRLERSINGAPPVQPIPEVVLNKVHYSDTATFRLPLLENNLGEGTNAFTAKVDLDPDIIEEQADDVFNNQAQKSIFIASSSLIPIYPYEFAIVPQSGSTLKASTGDPFAPMTTYFFEIDTTDLFNSPVAERGTVAQTGGVVEWQPQSIYTLDQSTDSLVYYWRCAPDSVGNGGQGFKWRESSFQHLTGREGWGQAHYFQFKNDGFSSTVYDRPGRDFDFNTGSASIQVSVQGNSAGNSNNFSEWTINGDRQEYNGCGAAPAIHVGVMDPNTLESWGTHYNGQNPQNSFGNLNDQGACRSRVEKYFIFRQNDQAQLQALENMILNAVPDSFYMVIYSWRYLTRGVSDGLNPGALTAVENLGGVNVRQIPDSVPYLLIVKKGDPSSVEERWGSSINDLISATAFAPINGNQGSISTPLAGPSTFWDALYFDEKPTGMDDSTSIMVYGVDAAGNETLLHEVQGFVDSVPDLENYADPNLYQRLRLRGFFSDSNIVAKPSQLRRWQLISAPVPECAIDPDLFFFEELDSLSSGQIGSVAVAVHNVSVRDMDSLLIQATVVGSNGQVRRVHYERHDPLPAGGVLIDTLTFSLAGIEGSNILVVEANPVDTLTGDYDQLEQYHFNNIAQIGFDVLVDRINPLLDVTFDGVHIINGDVVSANPEILIQLDDENEVLLLDEQADTSNFRVFLFPPGNSAGERVYFRMGALENMQFIPADGVENVSQILYRPNFKEDGVYKLLVQASDISQNASGERDYEILFEVINEATITDVVNYPNPFTTSTRFVFTLTGSSPPDQMKIRIMTISGRVVREIHMDELGPLRVGKNISEYAWDGRDMFGDKLARGVYLYTVDARLNGEDIKYRESGASPFFKKGVGKMYLLH